MNAHGLLSLAGLLALSLPAPLAAQGVNQADPDLRTQVWNGQSVVADTLLVAFDPGTSSGVRAALHEIVGLGASETVSRNLDRITLPAGADLNAAMQLYAGRSQVRSVLPDVLLQAVGVPNDPKWNQQWALPQISAPEGWELASGSAECVVAIIDSGVKTDHVDLDAHYAWGYDFYANDSNPADTNGHGTHCAGIATAETNNAVGVAGVANGCHYAAYRAGNSSFPTSSLVASIDDAVDQGAQVISMSWGSSYNNPLIRFALEDAADAGCVLVAAAGNDNTSSKFYPAGLDEVIAIASSSPSDARSSFSNYGSWVSVAAPGQSIYSTANTGGYVYKSGTSMACPLVAGMATLLYAHLGGTRSVANANAVRAALEDSAVPVGNWVEHGRVDLPAAIAELSTPEAPVLLNAAPITVQGFGGETITLSGSGFVGADDVRLGGHSAASFSVLSDSTLEFVAPSQSALGIQDVQVFKDNQVSATLNIEVLSTHPPRLLANTDLEVGDTLDLALGGGPDNTWLLLADLAGQTFAFRGSQLMFPFQVLTSNALDGAGLAELHLNVTPVVAGLSIYLQIATLDNGAFVGASEVQHVQVAP